GHEVDGFGSDLLGGECDVAFVLAVLVIDDDDHAPGPDLLDRSGNVDEWLVAHDEPIVAKLVRNQGPNKLSVVACHLSQTMRKMGRQPSRFGAFPDRGDHSICILLPEEY